MKLTTELTVKLILGFFLIIILISFFTNLIPFFSKTQILSKIVMIGVIVVLYDKITWILLKLETE